MYDKIFQDIEKEPTKQKIQAFYHMISEEDSCTLAEALAEFSKLLVKFSPLEAISIAQYACKLAYNNPVVLNAIENVLLSLNHMDSYNKFKKIRAELTHSSSSSEQVENTAPQVSQGASSPLEIGKEKEEAKKPVSQPIVIPEIDNANGKLEWDLELEISTPRALEANPFEGNTVRANALGANTVGANTVGTNAVGTNALEGPTAAELVFSNEKVSESSIHTLQKTLTKTVTKTLVNSDISVTFEQNVFPLVQNPSLPDMQAKESAASDPEDNRLTFANIYANNPSGLPEIKQVISKERFSTNLALKNAEEIDFEQASNISQNEPNFALESDAYMQSSPDPKKIFANFAAPKQYKLFLDFIKLTAFDIRLLDYVDAYADSFLGLIQMVEFLYRTKKISAQKLPRVLEVLHKLNPDPENIKIQIRFMELFESNQEG